MTKAAYVCIGIGKDAKTIVLNHMYYLDELLEKLPVGTSATVTTIESIDNSEDIMELLNVKEEEV